MKIGIVMDKLSAIKAYKDSTVAMIQAAQRRNHACYYFTPQDIYAENGQGYASAASIIVKDTHQPSWYETGKTLVWPLVDFDCILMRKDPPFNLEYIYTTYLLELVQSKVLIANNPQSLREVNEKFYTLYFPECCPPTLVSCDINQLKQFWLRHQQVIFKPLDGMGGQGIFYIDEQGKNLAVVLELLTHNQTSTIMAQRYIPEIKTHGDKRVILINGEPMPYALARIPQAGELRGNLAAGAKGQAVSINARDKWIAEQLKPMIVKKGLYFVGLDIIGDYLTEINVTSPTGICEIYEQTGFDIADQYLEFLESIKF